MRKWVAVLAVSLLPAQAALGTVFVPVSPEGLVRSSVASVLGTISEISGVRAPDGRIFTLVRIEVERTLHGSVGTTAIVLKEDGGEADGWRSVVFGSPEYRVGERVLVFLDVRPDGSLRTNHMALGKFRLVDLPGGMAAVRTLGGGRLFPGETFDPVILFERLEKAAAEAPAGTAASFRPVPPEYDDPSLRKEVTAEFAFLRDPPARHFVADEGAPLLYLVDQAGDALLGFENSLSAVESAFSAWSDVPTASIELDVEGLTSELSRSCPGPNKIVFNDPFEEIPDPDGCNGVLGRGGFTAPSSVENAREHKVFDGQTFVPARCAYVVLNDGLEGCSSWDPCGLPKFSLTRSGTPSASATPRKIRTNRTRSSRTL